jgi:nitrate reductase assembly molybdenum cofactor insertion protein NarJ
MGPFLDTEFGQKALAFFKEHPDAHPTIAPEGWGASVEYKYLADQRKTGVYDDFWITRTSVLPRSKAANTETKGGVIVALTKQQRDGLQEIDPEGAEDLIEAAEGRTKELDALLEHKAASPAKVASALRKLAKAADGDMASKLEELASALGEEEEDEMDKEEKGQEAQLEEQEPEPEPQPEPEAEIDLAALADELVKRFEVHLQPIAEMEKRLEAQESANAELREALKAYAEAEDRRRDENTPRFSLSLEKRASRAAATQVEDDDELATSGPETTKAASGSGASHFFPEK